MGNPATKREKTKNAIEARIKKRAEQREKGVEQNSSEEDTTDEEAATAPSSSQTSMTTRHEECRQRIQRAEQELHETRRQLAAEREQRQAIQHQNAKTGPRTDHQLPDNGRSIPPTHATTLCRPLHNTEIPSSRPSRIQVRCRSRVWGLLSEQPMERFHADFNNALARKANTKDMYDILMFCTRESLLRNAIFDAGEM